jgi:hypothetical protein
MVHMVMNIIVIVELHAETWKTPCPGVRGNRDEMFLRRDRRVMDRGVKSSGGSSRKSRLQHSLCNM